jgi:predicted transcriptional regulator
MQHRGELVEKAVRQSGFPLTKLAERLGKSRRWIYNAFENAQLPIDHILRIGKIIHHDFSDEIEELKGKSLQTDETFMQPYGPVKDAEYWRSKYYEVLEKYNALLETVSRDN